MPRIDQKFHKKITNIQVDVHDIYTHIHLHPHPQKNPKKKKTIPT